MVQRYLVFWLVLSSLLAAIWPRFAIPVDPFVESKPLLGWVVAVTMFCVGAILPRREVLLVARRWPLVFGGTAVQYAAMPFLAWALATLFRFSDELRIGMIMVGCVPGAMASNVLTLVARGNVSYSVGLTTSATLLSPVIVPVALSLTLQADADIELLLNASLLLCLQVVLPVLTGFVLSQNVPSFQALASRYASLVANLAILWIIAVVVGLNRERILNLPVVLMTALLLLNVIGYAAGYFGGGLLRISPGMRRALMLEVGMQNAGVGASLATKLFPDLPGVSLPCGLFAFGCMLTGTVLAQALASFSIPDDSIEEQTT